MKPKIKFRITLMAALLPLILNAQWTRVGNKTYVTNIGDSIGIGTTNPQFKLDIQSAGTATMSFKSTNGNASILVDRSDSTKTSSLTYRTNGVNNWQSGVVGNNNYTIRNNNLASLAFYISYANNNVGIGTNSPAATLDVIRGSSSSSLQVRGTTYHNYFNYGANDDTYINGGKSGSRLWLNYGANGIVNVANVTTETGKFNVQGKLGNTVASFGTDETGVSIVAAFPEVHFNSYSNSGLKAMAPGYSSALAFDPVTGTMLFRNTSSAAGSAGTTVTQSTRLLIDKTGNVGIGTVSPIAKLHVAGAESTTHGKNAAIEITNTSTGGTNWYLRSGAAGTATPRNGFSIANELGYFIVIDSIGQVAINTTVPANGYQLSVNGKIICEELGLQIHADWPDYVFDKKYDLKSISDVKEYVESNKHLPGVPSATEIKSKGIAVGEMQATLLKKIEELTLYVIAQDEKINQMQQKLNELAK